MFQNSMLSGEPTGLFFKEENGTVELEGPGSPDTPTPKSGALEPTSLSLVSFTGFEGVRERVSFTGFEGVREREAPDLEQ